MPWVVAYTSALLNAGVSLAGRIVATYAPIAFQGGGFGVQPAPLIASNPFSPSPARRAARQSSPSPSDFITVLNSPVDDSRDDPSIYIVRYTPGKEFVVGLDITNTGRWGITVTGVPLTTPDGPSYWQIIGIDMSAAGANFGHPQQVVPFHPFALLPGRGRWIEVHYQFRSCPSVIAQNGAFEVTRSWPVSFRVFGVVRHQEFRLPMTVAIQASGPPC